MASEKLTVELTEESRRDLALITERLGISLSEALSRAVGMEAFLIEEENAGTKIILQDRAGRVRELTSKNSF